MFHFSVFIIINKIQEVDALERRRLPLVDPELGEFSAQNSGRIESLRPETMSSVYVSEPPTKGKVILTTTYGPLDIELWPKEAPKAVRNFVQLCLEGYYDKTIFHRIIKGFLVQGGDPTGTGTGTLPPCLYIVFEILGVLQFLKLGLFQLGLGYG